MYSEPAPADDMAESFEDDALAVEEEVIIADDEAPEMGLSAMESLPVIAVDTQEEAEQVEAIEPEPKVVEAPAPELEEPAGAITSAGNFTIGGVIGTGENKETANLPRLPVNAHERFRTVRATSYFHGGDASTGSDTRSALGSELQAGLVRSAAADWSHYPVGTRFRIVGDTTEQEYVVDDFEDGLSGPDAVELYMPTRQDMEAWGSRSAVIEVLNWGSFEKSLAIMKSSEARMADPHVLRMVNSIEERFEDQSKASRGLRLQGGGLLERIANRKANR